MYQTIGNCAYISGIKGRYDKRVDSTSVRYGRNAINNLQKYKKDLANASKPVKFPDMSNFIQSSPDEQEKLMRDFDKAINKIGKFPPLHYQCQYMPTTHINKMALMGAAYEKMGKKSSISTQEMTELFKKQTHIQEIPENIINYTASPMDVNKDGMIDLSECATGLLLADALDESENFSVKNIDGVITDEGELNLPFFHADFNIRAANRAYHSLHSTYQLYEAQEEFLKNKNNLI